MISLPTIVPTTRLTLRNGQLGDDFFLPLDGGFAKFEQRRVVERLVEAVVLRNLAVTPDLGSHFGLIKDLAEIQAARLPVLDCFLRFEPVGAANHFVDRAEAELRHQFANFLGDKTHEVDGVRGIAGEILAQIRVLAWPRRPDRCSDGKPAS